MNKAQRDESDEIMKSVRALQDAVGRITPADIENYTTPKISRVTKKSRDALQDDIGYLISVLEDILELREMDGAKCPSEDVSNGSDNTGSPKGS